MNTIIREAIRNVLSEARESYEQKLNQLKKRGVSIEKEFFDEINSVDPTSVNGTAGKYFDWIMKNLTIYRDTDEELLRNCLEFFERKKQLIANKGMDTQIASYNVESLIKLVKSLSDTSLEWENAMRRFGNDVQIVYKDNRYVVVHCNTWEAERFFGRKTSWCTVVNSDQFKRYNKNGLLFICIPIENGKPNIDSEYKMQCDVSNDQFHCANAKDRVFHSFNDYYQNSRRRWQYDKPMIQALMKINKLFQVPTDYEEGDIRVQRRNGVVPLDEMDKYQRMIYEAYNEYTEETETSDAIYIAHTAYIDDDEIYYAIIDKGTLNEVVYEMVLENTEDDLNCGYADMGQVIDYIYQDWKDSFCSEYAEHRLEDAEWNYNSKGVKYEDASEETRDSEDFDCNESGKTRDEMYDDEYEYAQDNFADLLYEFGFNTKYLYQQDAINVDYFIDSILDSLDTDDMLNDYVFYDTSYLDYKEVGRKVIVRVEDIEY